MKRSKNNAVENNKLKDEIYYHSISEIEDYAIILLNTEGIITNWNKGAEKIKGYKAEEILGKSFKVFYPKEDLEKKLPETLIEQAIKEGKASHEGWRVKKNREVFWANVVITALHNEDNELVGFIKITRDLTERKQVEDQLLEHTKELRDKNEFLRMSEERYHKMISEVQDYAIILLSKEGIIENWNLGAEKIKGYKAEEILGKSFKVFYSKDDQEKKLPELLLNKARQSGRVEHEGWRVRKDGTTFWGNVVITSLHDDQRNIIGFLKMTRDLTERKNTEDELKLTAQHLAEKNIELQKANQELLSFAYISSHDLQEPLRKIQAFSNRITELDKESLSEKGKDYFNRIHKAASRMRLLIDDLLIYSRTNSSERDFILTDLNELVQDVKNELEEIFEEKNAVLEVSVLPQIPVITFQVHQLLTNILANALKFSKTDRAPHIIIKADIIQGNKIRGSDADPGKPYHHISISDNGIGFDPEYNTRIFEIFQRLHRREEYVGTGVGLAICKRIMDNHKGIILAEGKPGIGATFHLYFPI